MAERTRLADPQRLQHRSGYYRSGRSLETLLGGLGYSEQEVRDWLVGPGYLGWMYMANVENISGPIPHDWFEKAQNLPGITSVPCAL
ncbi:hypothetical protein KWG61_04375 [Allobaculum sp. Allo2]|nr:hypothetical protein KWG61_04375 [Allobaculum sp. Allo2]